MALEELISRLERDAEQRIAALRSSAAAQAKAPTEQAERQRDAALTAELKSRRARLTARLDRELAVARQRCRAERLAAQHALVGRVRARARELAGEVGRSSAFAQAVPRQLAEALRYLEGERVVVRCRPELAAIVGQALGSNGEVVVDSAAGWGVCVQLVGGRVTIDQTLEARLAAAEPELAVEVVREVLA